MSNAQIKHDIVSTLAALWTEHPQLRFTQLVQLVAGDGDPFYMEDNLFLRKANAKLEDAVLRGSGISLESLTELAGRRPLL